MEKNKSEAGCGAAAGCVKDDLHGCAKDTLFSIGEALIDMIPAEKGCEFAEVTSFMPALGGAPANVCAAFTRLGGRSEMLTQLGDDPFGHKIASELAEACVGTEHISFTDEANTCLAFVSLAADGNRTFSFYRKPSADLLYKPEQIDGTWFDRAYALHFCSVSLAPSPMKEAHVKAIAEATARGALISFDPNLRFPLWPDREALRETVLEFLPKAHVVKISDEELAFLTGCESIEEALPRLFAGNVELVLYTCGKDGAKAYTKTARAEAPGCPVEAVDTTGAGDAFAGAFLHCLYEAGITPAGLAAITPEQLEQFLAYANTYSAQTVRKKGAIPSYPGREEFEALLQG